MAANDTSISVTGDAPTIRGEVKADREVDRAEYYLRKHRHGAFTRSLALPTSVKADKADAQFENGILTLTLPKAEEIKPKAIAVKTK